MLDTYENMLAFCDSQKEADGFCWICSSCSGPCPSNLATDRPMPDGVMVYRGGHHGECVFEVKENR